MVLIDLISALFVCGALLAAAIAGHFSKGALPIARAMILPAGIVGTFIGFVQILQQMDDPMSIFPAVSIALLTTLYAALFKLGLDVRFSASPAPAPSDPGLRGWMAATLWLILVVGASLTGSPIIAFFDLWALVLLALSVLSICGLTLAAKDKNIPGALVRFLPGAGLFILVLLSQTSSGALNLGRHLPQSRRAAEEGESRGKPQPGIVLVSPLGGWPGPLGERPPYCFGYGSGVFGGELGGNPCPLPEALGFVADGADVFHNEFDV